MQYSGAGAESYAPFSFNYIAELEDGSSSRSESGDGSGKVTGSYSLSGNDGRKRQVDYLADQAGFRATINTNEFGTKSDSPADIQFYSTAVQEAPQAPSAPAYKANKGHFQSGASATQYKASTGQFNSGASVTQYKTSGSSGQFKSSFAGQQRVSIIILH
ncbi:unnamed protein product [Larinioides sclopetarius]|uniref:Uncharacterized protein n=1 Tax=Larinioides sclopetarius TaxID=280406 RepID=A0AAV1ZDZ8_9ARAC